MHRFSPRRTYANATRRKAAGIAIAGAILAALTLAATASAATYYACVKTKGGAIRIVSKATKCKRTERKISFNSQGVPGSNGLNGRNGRNGANGANGTNGTNGANGATGFTSTLPKGATELGTWAILIPTEKAGGVSSISFNIPLASGAAVTLIAKGGSPTPACPGTVTAPAATSGNLCIYTSTSDHIAEIVVFDPSREGGLLDSAGPWGATVNAATGAAVPGVAYGTWAVTG